MLAYYASRLDTVEVNATFYRHPTAAAVQTWVQSVPESFRFAVKAHHRITHQRRLRVGQEDLELFATWLSEFGPKLGPVLFQLPPTAAWSPGVLEGFLPLLSPNWRIAFQFRHPSWHQDDVIRILERAGAALCHADGEPEPGPLGQGAFVYVRLRRAAYSDEELDRWAAQLHAYVDGGRDVFAYFKHEALAPTYALAITATVQTSARPDIPASV